VSRIGACSDSKIKEILGHIPGVTTKIVGMDEKVLNQQRALWLTPDKARNIMIDRTIKQLEDNGVRKKKKMRKNSQLLRKGGQQNWLFKLQTVIFRDDRIPPLLE
jgi:hypothetical protein